MTDPAMLPGDPDEAEEGSPPAEPDGPKNDPVPEGEDQ